MPANTSQSTLLRHFHRLELMGPAVGEALAVFGRFEAADPNELWCGDRLCRGISDRLAVDAQCLMDLHLGSAGVPVPEHLHEVSHVPRSPRHLRPLPEPRGGAPERSEPEQHPNPAGHAPRGELRDGQPLHAGNNVTADT